MGGRKSLVISYLIAVVFGGALLLLSSYENLIVLFLFGAKLGVAATYNVLTIVNINSFPQDFRTTSFGICNFFARISGITAPLCAELSEPIPLTVFIILCLVQSIFSLFLKENSQVSDIH